MNDLREKVARCRDHNWTDIVTIGQIVTKSVCLNCGARREWPGPVIEDSNSPTAANYDLFGSLATPQPPQAPDE